MEVLRKNIWHDFGSVHLLNIIPIPKSSAFTISKFISATFKSQIMAHRTVDSSVSKLYMNVRPLVDVR
jgi:hypothetical protein